MSTSNQSAAASCLAVVFSEPGREELARMARISVEQAITCSPGPFASVSVLQLDQDPAEPMGCRSQAVLHALTHGHDWILMLDADAVLLPQAFAEVTPLVAENDAVFGRIVELDEHGKAALRPKQMRATSAAGELLFHDPYTGVATGFFVRTQAAAVTGFEASLGVGGDYMFLLELWERFRCRKTDHMFSLIQQRRATVLSPAWRQSVAAAYGAFCAGRRISVNFEAGNRKVGFAIGNPLDLIQRHHVHGRFFETTELAWLQEHIPAGAVILEIGANVGNHLVYYGLLMQPARIIPVEPNPAAIALLQRNIELNGLTEVVDMSLLGIGLGEQRGRSALTWNAANMGAAHLLEPGDGGIEIWPLDEKFQGHVDFIKIDVESMEMEVLRGAERLIGTSRPVMLVEVRNEKTEEFLQWLAGRQYALVHTFHYVNARNHVVAPLGHDLLLAK